MGFVSNSSSCSFTIMASEAAYQRVYNSVDEMGKLLMDTAWGEVRRFKVGDVELMDLSYVSHDGGYWMYLCEGLDQSETYEHGQKIVEALKNDKGAYVNVESC